MRRRIVLIVFAVLVAALSHAATFQGEIADSSCALNVHSLSRSHKEMLKSRSFGPDAASCARHCVAQFASSYVLVEKKNVYRLDNQERAEKWAGQAVIVTGELDVKKNVITVGSIQLVESHK
jgi:histidyl-tRNA synthetase